MGCTNEGDGSAGAARIFAAGLMLSVASELSEGVTERQQGAGDVAGESQGGDLWWRVRASLLPFLYALMISFPFALTLNLKRGRR